MRRVARLCVVTSGLALSFHFFLPVCIEDPTSTEVFRFPDEYQFQNHGIDLSAFYRSNRAHRP